MSEVFGGQTMIFVAITDGVKDRLGVAAQIRTPVSVTGCRFRPLTAQEKVALTDEAIEIWKGTAPPDPKVLSAKAVDEVQVDGVTYQIDGGVKPFPDADGRPYKVTVLCKLENV